MPKNIAKFSCNPIVGILNRFQTFIFVNEPKKLGKNGVGSDPTRIKGIPQGQFNLTKYLRIYLEVAAVYWNCCFYLLERVFSS